MVLWESSGLDDGEYGYLRYGVSSFLVRDPLVYFEDNVDQGAVVARRLLNHVGAESIFSKGLEFMVPSLLRCNGPQRSPQ